MLDSYDALLKGGKSGAAISAGNADQSRLIRMLTGEAKPVMPPDDGESERPEARRDRAFEAVDRRRRKGPTGKAPDPTMLVTPSIKPTVRSSPRDHVGRLFTQWRLDRRRALSHGGVDLGDNADRSPIGPAARRRSTTWHSPPMAAG